MSTGYSLHIGVNQYDPAHYNKEGKLKACEADARSMERIAADQGFNTTLLLTTDARRDAVLDHINNATKELTAGDMYFITYAGHGGRVPDTSGEERDGKDETWCLYDGQLLDDEITVAFAGFREGVRVLLISDSCHSGTIVRSAGNDLDALLKESPDGVGFRTEHPRASKSTYARNREFYDSIISSLPRKLPEPRAAVKSICACHDDQLAADGKVNGFFTTHLLEAWDDGHFDGSYKSLYGKVKRSMWWKTLWNGKNQVPVYMARGPKDNSFERAFEL